MEIAHHSAHRPSSENMLHRESPQKKKESDNRDSESCLSIWVCVSDRNYLLSVRTKPYRSKPVPVCGTPNECCEWDPDWISTLKSSIRAERRGRPSPEKGVVLQQFVPGAERRRRRVDHKILINIHDTMRHTNTRLYKLYRFHSALNGRKMVDSCRVNYGVRWTRTGVGTLVEGGQAA